MFTTDFIWHATSTEPWAVGTGRQGARMIRGHITEQAVVPGLPPGYGEFRCQNLEDLKSSAFWDATPCSPVEVNWRFAGTPSGFTCEPRKKPASGKR
jgi:hypothetical protein